MPDVPTPTDLQLLGDHVDHESDTAFQSIVARHAGWVFASAYRQLHDRHLAEDATQTVFLLLVQKAHLMRSQQKLSGWLFNTLHYAVRNIQRAACRREFHERRAAIQKSRASSAPTHDDDLAAQLDAAVYRLHTADRTAILLRFYRDLSFDQVADSLNVTEAAARKRVGRAIHRVRKLLASPSDPAALASATSIGLALVPSNLTRSIADAALSAKTGALPTATVAAMKGTAIMAAAKTKLLVAGTIGAIVLATAGTVAYRQITGAVVPASQEVKPDHEQPVVQLDDPLPPGATLRLGTSRFRHGIPVSALAISADGKLAVAVNGNHMLGATRAFDLVSGRALYTLGGSEGTDIEAAAIAPDGRTIVTKQDFSLRVRDAATGKELRKIELQRANGSYSRNEWLAFTPDGKALAVTSQGKVVHLIDFESGKTIREFSNDNPESTLSSGFDTILGIAFSPDGKLMASGGFANNKDNYFARLWDVQTGKELRRFMHGRSYGIESLAFSPDGKKLATGAHDSRLRLFDMNSGKQLRAFPKNGKSRMHGGCVAFAPDGKTVATAGDSLRLYDVASGQERWHIDRKAVGLQFTDGGKTLSGAVMGTIHRWDTATGKSLTPEAGDSIVEQIIVSADGSRVVTRGQDGDAHIWNSANGQHLRYLNVASQRGLAMSPDGRFLVWPIPDASVHFTDPQFPNMSHDGSRIRLYDITADKLVDRFPGFKGDANNLTFIDDGRRLVTVDYRDGGVRVWKVETGKEERSFQAVREEEKRQSNPVCRTELSPDGKTLAVAYVLRPGGRGGITELGGRQSETYPIRVWDVATGKELHQFDGHARYVQNMAFSPDGRWLVSSGSAFDQMGAKDQLFIWDVHTGKTAATLPTGACAVAFSGDGRCLATATPEGAIRLWETATWTLRSEYSGHRDRPTALAFAPNRPLLFSGSADTTVLAWALATPPATQASNAHSEPAPPDVLLLANDSFNFPVDPDVSRNGGPPALLLLSAAKPMEIVRAGRHIDIARFAGKRVRFSAYVKTAGKLTNFASLHLHVFDEKGRATAKTYALDDMLGRGLTKPADWTRLEIVADIAPAATGFYVGVQLKGSGQLWMDGARLEVVGKDVPTTDDSTNHLYTDLLSNYTVTLDPAVMRNGHPTVCITSSNKPTNSFAWYGVNNRFPEPYLGHRIRITGWAKCENVTKGGRIACWAISREGGLLCLDNPAERVSIKGTTDWKKYQITATVPAALDHLDPGFNLFGNGKLWIDELAYELIPDDEFGL